MGTISPRQGIFASILACAWIAMLGVANADEPQVENTPADAPATGAATQPAAPASEPHGLARWLDPSTAPFLPVPEIGVDPNSGTTLGLIPTILKTNERQEIYRIVAPTIDYNPYFGVGLSASIYDFPSADTQWSVVAGAQQRVQRNFDYEYIAGRERDTTLTFAASVVYERIGTPRFYGIGNTSPVYDESDYTLSQKYVQTLLGYNITHAWQIAWVFRPRDVDVEPGSLVHIASLTTRFGDILGVGVNHETLNRLEIIYDTRDDLSVPTRGGEYVLFGGAAGRTGLLDSSLYSVTGIDARQYWPTAGCYLNQACVVVAHTALRYMPGVTHVPFWSLSEIGGDQSVIGEEQPLRGFGEGRFYGRNSFDASIEIRQRVMSLDAISTHINVEFTPFLDVGEVFAHSHDLPFSQLHKVIGMGFRGIASPFVVGFLDVGYGSEGVAVFTGINYPF